MPHSPAPFELLNPNPTQRDPRACPWGLFISHAMSADGSQAFYWFAHEVEAVRFITDCLNRTFPWDELGVLMEGVETLAHVPIESIHEAQVTFTIRWAGRVEELLESQSRFAKEIRNDFATIFTNGFHLHSIHDCDQFIAQLDRYADRFSAKASISSFKLPGRW